MYYIRLGVLEHPRIAFKGKSLGQKRRKVKRKRKKKRKKA